MKDELRKGRSTFIERLHNSAKHLLTKRATVLASRGPGKLPEKGTPQKWLGDGAEGLLGPWSKGLLRVFCAGAIPFLTGATPFLTGARSLLLARSKTAFVPADHISFSPSLFISLFCIECNHLFLAIHSTALCRANALSVF